MGKTSDQTKNAQTDTLSQTQHIGKHPILPQKKRPKYSSLRYKQESQKCTQTNHDQDKQNIIQEVLLPHNDRTME